jgi:hypothetical protein
VKINATRTTKVGCKLNNAASFVSQQGAGCSLQIVDEEFQQLLNNFNDHHNTSLIQKFNL